MANCNCNSNCNPCPPCEPQFPTTCESLDLTTSAKQLIVQDNAECPTILATPTQAAVPRRGSSTNVEWATGSNGEVLVVKNGQPAFADGSSIDAISIPSLKSNTTTNATRIVTQDVGGDIEHWRPATISPFEARLVYEAGGAWEIETLNNLLPSGNGTVFIRDNAGALQAVTGNPGDILQIVGSNPAFITPAASSTFPAGHLYGLVLSNNSASPNKEIDVTTGECRAYNSTQNIVLASGFTKTCTGVFAAGTGNAGNLGGVPNPSTATTLHVFVIQGASGTDIAFYNLPSAAGVLPSGYDQAWRRIGSVVTDSSGNIIQFVQSGDRFLYKAGPIQLTTASVPTGGATITIPSLPSGIQVYPALNIIPNVEAYFAIYDLASTTWPSVQAPGNGASGTYIASGLRRGDITFPTASFSFINCHGPGFILTNTSQQIGIDTSAAGTFEVDTWGYIDTRNRLQP